MCGIAGLLRFDEAPADRILLGEMTSQLEHRGPDESGTWAGVDAARGIGLGHARLSIIDLAGSRQPMHTKDGRYHLVFNGEIFNYRELRAGLDYPFTTRGDTEVLLAGLVTKGDAFVSELTGQFAFALVDTVARSVLLGRDRVGILPLYYQLDGRRLVFASEIKAILPALGDAVAVDHGSLDSYLAHNAVHAPFTLFAGVRKIRPAELVRVDGSGAVRTHQYWAPPGPGEVLTVSPQQAVAAVEGALTRAVQSALVADVPVGAYLSGGLDSSLITALVRQAQPGSTIDTFSAGFGDPRFDELPHARRVSEHLRTRHHEVHVRPEDFTELWDDLTWFRDAPLSQPADVAVHMLAKLARQHVKVVLSGEGSDELFAGYRKYRFARPVAATDMVPGGLAAWAARVAEPRLPARVAKAGIVLRAIASDDPIDRLDSWFAPFTPAQRASLLAGTNTENRPVREVAAGVDPIRSMLEHDLQGWLPDNLLERGDRMSMAASLELRPPFLDRELVDLAFRLPSSVKVRRGVTKWVVKQVGGKYLPQGIADRPKVGFRVPLDTWFKGALRPMARDLLVSRDSFVAQALDRNTIEALLAAHEAGVRNEEERIWTLLSLEIWHRRFFGS